MASFSPEFILNEVLKDDTPLTQRALHQALLRVSGGTIDQLLLTRTKEAKENMVLLMAPAHS